jgi:hypothetical protein
MMAVEVWERTRWRKEREGIRGDGVGAEGKKGKGRMANND